MSDISIIPTSNDTFNVIGTNDVAFILQGNLNLDQLEELRDEIDKVLHKDS
jgi:hypothetical protein